VFNANNRSVGFVIIKPELLREAFRYQLCFVLYNVALCIVFKCEYSFEADGLSASREHDEALCFILSDAVYLFFHHFDPFVFVRAVDSFFECWIFIH
jgi:hypothetical protein